MYTIQNSPWQLNADKDVSHGSRNQNEDKQYEINTHKSVNPEIPHFLLLYICPLFYSNLKLIKGHCLVIILILWDYEIAQRMRNVYPRNIVVDRMPWTIFGKFL